MKKKKLKRVVQFIIRLILPVSEMAQVDNIVIKNNYKSYQQLPNNGLLFNEF